MDKIVQGTKEHIGGCEEALLHSELGNRYFSETGSARKALEEGFGKGQIYVALDEEGICRGFIWFILNGIFHSFPYLHIIAVKAEGRNKGTGKKLLQYFEDFCFAEHSKVFLVVADFNSDAQRFYESAGYVQVGSVPGLYREGITEYFMMKVRK